MPSQRLLAEMGKYGEARLREKMGGRG